jgi:hypothetical protein
MPLDFVAPSAGAVLVLQSSIVLRHWCVDGIVEVDAISFVPRIEGEGLGGCPGRKACSAVTVCAHVQLCSSSTCHL